VCGYPAPEPCPLGVACATEHFLGCPNDIDERVVCEMARCGEDHRLPLSLIGKLGAGISPDRKVGDWVMEFARQDGLNVYTIKIGIREAVSAATRHDIEFRMVASVEPPQMRAHIAGKHNHDNRTKITLDSASVGKDTRIWVSFAQVGAMFGSTVNPSYTTIVGAEIDGITGDDFAQGLPTFLKAEQVRVGSTLQRNGFAITKGEGKVKNGTYKFKFKISYRQDFISASGEVVDRNRVFASSDLFDPIEVTATIVIANEQEEGFQYWLFVYAVAFLALVALGWFGINKIIGISQAGAVKRNQKAQGKSEKIRRENIEKMRKESAET